MTGHEFQEPVRETAPCTKYTAAFGATFAPFDEEFGRDFLRPGCPRYSDQLAMQEYQFARMEMEFRNSFPRAAAKIAELAGGAYLTPQTAQLDCGAEQKSYVPTAADARELVLRQIRARRGQQDFRDKLRKRYGDQCMISGCTTLHVIEAAHISPYRGPADNHPENGLLLRSDLHTLFDLDLIGIDPDSFKIRLHPSIRMTEYAQFQDKRLSCGDSSPGESALRIRWAAFGCRRADEL